MSLLIVEMEAHKYEIETLQEKITKQHSEILEKKSQLEAKNRVHIAMIHQTENLKALLDEKEGIINLAYQQSNHQIIYLYD